jgi:hypothetical protein
MCGRFDRERGILNCGDKGATGWRSRGPRGYVLNDLI